MSLVPVTRKVPAGIAGILAGSLGLHKFIMGFPRAGVLMLGITVACWLLHFIPFLGFFGWGFRLMALIGFVEGIIYLVKNDSDFYRDYTIKRQEWF